MFIELRQIRYFMAVAETLHFRKAADKLSIAQPALSRAVHLLEEEIGTNLFDRTTRRVSLTTTGKVFLEGCRDVQTCLKLTLERTRKSQTGELGNLIVGYTDFAINDKLPSIVKAFRNRYAEVSVEPRHGFTSSQLTDLTEGNLDIGFVTGPVRHPQLEVLPITASPFVVILPETHALAAQQSISILDLVTEPFVLGSEEGWEHYHDHLYRLCRSFGFEPNVVQRAFNTEGVFGLIACGMGLTIQPECMANYIRKGLLVRPLKEESDMTPIVAVWNKSTLTPVRERFVNFLQEYIHVSNQT